MFEAVDVITLIKGGVYDDLNLNVGEALQKRSEVCAHTGYLRGILTESRISLGYTLALFMTAWIRYSTPSGSPECIGWLW